MNEHDLDVQRRRKAAKLPKEGLIAAIEEKKEDTNDGCDKHQNQSNNKAGNAVDSQVDGDRDDTAK